MITKLSQRDKRALKLGGVIAAAIVLFALGSTWLDNWAAVRTSLKKAKADLKIINPDNAKLQALLSVVPKFEIPQTEETQKLLFRDKFNEQLKKAGIKAEPLQALAPVRSPNPGCKLLRLKCKAKCTFEQMLNLLADLNDNPYLVGVEEFNIKCDPKKRQEIVLNLTVSTFSM